VRYDLWPVLCVLVAVLLVERRPGMAGVALGLGAMLKLYPIAVLPALAAYTLAERDRGGFVRLLAGCASVIAAVMVASWALAGPDSLGWLRYQEDRGLQIESLGAGLLLALHVAAGQPLDVAYGFGTVQVQAPGADLLAAASPLAVAALLAVVIALTWLRFRADHDRLGHVPRSSLVLASAAAIAALLVGAKVLSVQYVIWLLPFVPLLPVRVRWLALAVVALSTAIYTVDYSALWRLETPMILVLLVRNILLALLALWLAAELAGVRRTAPAAEAGRA
jgi:hypothetical protein